MFLLARLDVDDRFLRELQMGLAAMAVKMIGTALTAKRHLCLLHSRAASVGLMTIAVFMKNTLRAAQIQDL
ncbi:MAG: hypothetical protein WCC12_08200 [Anaerolineales bacterium]